MDAHSEAILGSGPPRCKSDKPEKSGVHWAALCVRRRSTSLAAPLPLWIKGRLLVIRENFLRLERCWPYVFVNPLDVKSIL
jgi:hypothetical protein